MKTVIPMGFVLLSTVVGWAQTTYFSADANHTFDLIYKYKLNSADSLVNKHINLRNLDPEWSMMKANVAWMQILSGYEKDPFWQRTFTHHIDLTEKHLSDKDELSDEEQFQFILSQAFITRFELLNENYLNAVSHLNTCIDEISNSFGRESRYEPFYLTSGLYYYFMDKAYEDYPLMRPYLMFYPDGDSLKGINYLKRASTSSDVMLRNESRYFLMRIFADLEKDYASALVYARKLVADYPDNLLYRTCIIDILLAQKEAQKGGSTSALIPEINRHLAIFRQAYEANSQLTNEQKAHFKRIWSDYTAQLGSDGDD